MIYIHRFFYEAFHIIQHIDTISAILFKQIPYELVIITPNYTIRNTFQYHTCHIPPNYLIIPVTSHHTTKSSLLHHTTHSYHSSNTPPQKSIIFATPTHSTNVHAPSHNCTLSSLSYHITLPRH